MNARILIVDDNLTNLKLASEVLVWAGCIVQQADSAARAIELLPEFNADLILMDIAMPGMDGLALTQRLKADSVTRDIPIVVLTASAMKGDEQRARAAGCDGYITKPIDTRQFARQVAAFLKNPPDSLPQS